ncbi:hypothetical protein FEM48_ZijujUnG0091700 [Ziziphus jujuba var. spinosa]|uniref:Transmembrane protein n=1 Tax=Ziziphus jujuba var. spinosa TaxID=714518 RepID=A0A978U8H9_ZIZJJ|nr:hypothetical protein FEM48_ZijujUnG0091700 [Ziziphus jujuba var. spinosa]
MGVYSGGSYGSFPVTCDGTGEWCIKGMLCLMKLHRSPSWTRRRKRWDVHDDMMMCLFVCFTVSCFLTLCLVGIIDRRLLF